MGGGTHAPEGNPARQRELTSSDMIAALVTAGYGHHSASTATISRQPLIQYLGSNRYRIIRGS
jgi:hypothetical protein